MSAALHLCPDPILHQSAGVGFRVFRAMDALQLPLQASQHVTAGLESGNMNPREAEQLERQGPAWTAFDDLTGEPLCCAGFWEVFRNAAGQPVQAHAWAMLALGLGPSRHLAITRFARLRFEQAPYVRIEALVRTGAEASWARLMGMTPNAVVRKWGAASEDHILMEMVR